MPADVVEGLQLPWRASRDDDALTRKLAKEELAWRLDLFDPPGANPVLREQPVHLDAKAVLVGVEIGRKGRRACRHDIAGLDGDVGILHGSVFRRSRGLLRAMIQPPGDATVDRHG